MTCRVIRQMLAGLINVVALAALAFFATGTGALAVPKPVIEQANGGECVAEPAFMRRNHMKLLKHQRDDTLRGGDRSGAHSLQACITCHAGKETHSVNASPTNFCQSCHSYAAVKIDCFECHSSKPKDAFSKVKEKP